MNNGATIGYMMIVAKSGLNLMMNSSENLSVECMKQWMSIPKKRQKYFIKITNSRGICLCMDGG